MNSSLTDLFSRTITGITGLQVNKDEQLETRELEGINFRCAPGLLFGDEAGVRSSRKSGWIFSYSVISKYLDDNFFIDWMSHEALEPCFAKFANSILRLHATRKDYKINMTAEDRKKVTQQIFDELLTIAGTENQKLCQEGFLTFRFKYEQPISSKSTVKRKLKKFAQGGIMPPLIASISAMEYLHREHDLLKDENVGDRSSINFDPNLSVRHSTATESMLEQSFSFIECDISDVTFQSETLQGDLTGFLEKSVVQLTTTDEFNGMVSHLNATISQQRNLCLIVEQQKKEVKLFKEGVEQKFLVKMEEVDHLKQSEIEQARIIQSNEARIEDLRMEISKITQDHDNQLDILEKQIVDQKEKESRMSIKKELDNTTMLTTATEQITDLENTLGASRVSKKELKDQLKKLKDDFLIRLQAKKEEADTIARAKEHLTLEVLVTRQKLQKIEVSNRELQEDKIKLEKRNTSLQMKMENLISLTRSLSDESDNAAIFLSTMQAGPQFKKPKAITRQDATDDTNLPDSNTVDH